MAAPAILPGRARLSFKLRTFTISIDTSACDMSEGAAMVVYTTAIGGKVPDLYHAAAKLVADFRSVPVRSAEMQELIEAFDNLPAPVLKELPA